MAKKSQQPQLPAWVWLFTGVITGLFAAFLVYLANIKGTPSQMAGLEERSPTQTSSKADKGGTEKGRKFEFYTLLPEAETMGSPSAEETSKSATGAKPEDKNNKPSATSAQKIMLQTGSFQNAQDADKQRAQLILLGLPASIQRVELRPGETWHRVQAGPFTDTENLAKAQKTLANSHIQHVVIRMKTP